MKWTFEPFWFHFYLGIVFILQMGTVALQELGQPQRFLICLIFLPVLTAPMRYEGLLLPTH
eukprot:3363415-Amphidinium_carterae.2